MVDLPLDYQSVSSRLMAKKCELNKKKRENRTRDETRRDDDDEEEEEEQTRRRRRTVDVQWRWASLCSLPDNIISASLRFQLSTNNTQTVSRPARPSVGLSLVLSCLSVCPSVRLSVMLSACQVYGPEGEYQLLAFSSYQSISTP
ncbi:uncharacterized protein MCYG_07357 [Microsporum canis CBS 113480]|uniref:Uncharacterized protein n=1 Tax=Arthroderma otae (strain ATCC MYA-4605 / CBS 113480) TaxID=554155 RepID=C5FYE0_ARTOC|nr:uncharacterized protein MCYG_07357 [Microsporum canis CBS 113480]EEQ34538.1 predicted protein [Microsporum canis CBS 113480]